VLDILKSFSEDPEKDLKSWNIKMESLVNYICDVYGFEVVPCSIPSSEIFPIFPDLKQILRDYKIESILNI